MTEYLVIFLPKVTYIHRIYMVLANPTYTVIALYAEKHVGTKVRHPTWYKGARHPTWYKGAEHPTWYKGAEHPTWYQGAQHPTWYQGARHPMWYKGARHPTWYQGARHPTYHNWLPLCLCGSILNPYMYLHLRSCKCVARHSRCKLLHTSVIISHHIYYI